MASSAVESTVESCAAEAAALGFTCTWHDRSTGAPAADKGPRAALTLRLAHESAEDAVHVDFLPVLDRVQIFAECGARRARCDVAAGAPGAGRRFAVHVLQPLVTGVVADETLLGLPESVRRVIYELLPAPAVGLVAETTKALRAEATSDVVWASLLRRDADALLIDRRDLPAAGASRRAHEIYAAFVQFRANHRRAEREHNYIGQLPARARIGIYEDGSGFGILSLDAVEHGEWERWCDAHQPSWAGRHPRGGPDMVPFLRDPVAWSAANRGPRWYMGET